MEAIKCEGSKIEQTSDVSIMFETNRHPWLGVFLNCFAFSGAGYLYCRRYGRVCLAVALSLMIYAVAYLLIFVESVSFDVLLITAIVSILVLKATVSIDVFRLIKWQNTLEFETMRKGGKQPWLAAFLAVIWPGLGLIYLRRWFFFFLYVFFYYCAGSLLPDNVPQILSHCLTFVVTAVMALFCYWLAMLQPSPAMYRIKTFLRYGAIVFAVHLLLFGILLFFVKHVMQTYEIVSGSMEPTIFTGERVFVDKMAYLRRTPVPGDIVLFQSPQAGKSWVKRVVATVGQRVDFTEAGVLFVDGEEVSYDSIFYEYEEDSLLAQQHRYMPYCKGYTVPDGSYFLVGDNYTESYDSRHFGPVADEKIIGKVVRVYDW